MLTKSGESLRHILVFDEFVNVLMFKLLDLLPHAIKGSSQRVSFVIADLFNQGV